jgi:hypothetical protein
MNRDFFFKFIKNKRKEKKNLFMLFGIVNHLVEGTRMSHDSSTDENERKKKENDSVNHKRSSVILLQLDSASVLDTLSINKWHLQFVI